MPAGPDEITTPGEAADHLYGVAPNEFISSRNALVKAIRSRGDRALADEIKAMRKPSVMAAELNRVLRASPADLDRLLETAKALASGHRSVLCGESVDLAALQEAHRRSVARMVDSVERHGDRIASLLEAVSLDSACHDGLRVACYVVEPVPQVGFALFADAPGEPPMASVTDLSEARAHKRASDRTAGTTQPTVEPDEADHADHADRADEVTKQVEEHSLRSARNRVAAMAREHGRAETALALVYRRVEAAVAKHARASERIAELSQRLAQAQADLEATESALATARRAAETAEAVLSSTADELRQARADLAEQESSD